jgi:hypothetical protein
MLLNEFMAHAARLKAWMISSGRYGSMTGMRSDSGRPCRHDDRGPVPEKPLRIVRRCSQCAALSIASLCVWAAIGPL